ncbi:MAG: RNHCP domain-containing protein [Anaerolineae bacterium]|nr:RNHCP domain-containing protein [Anaerolineae bacterium]
MNDHLKSNRKYQHWNNPEHYKKSEIYQSTIGFTCRTCGMYVVSNVDVSGVNNRNHCPYCLWSKHVDLFRSGDRLAACKAPMRPIGLTLKQSRKKYNPLAGELMIIHLCSLCGALSINRIAADDLTERIMDVYRDSTHINWQSYPTLLEKGITPLKENDIPLIKERLMGCVC